MEFVLSLLLLVIGLQCCSAFLRFGFQPFLKVKHSVACSLQQPMATTNLFPSQQNDLLTAIRIVDSLPLKDLDLLTDQITIRKMKIPLNLIPNEQFDKKLEIWDEGPGGDLHEGNNIRDCLIHSFLIKWKNGDESHIRIASQEGVFFTKDGGSEENNECVCMYKVDYFELDDFDIIGSYPRYQDKLPRGFRGTEQLKKLLKAHDVTKPQDIYNFIQWLVGTIELNNRSEFSIAYALQHGDMMYEEEAEEYVSSPAKTNREYANMWFYEEEWTL